jgi:hypothetical protein
LTAAPSFAADFSSFASADEAAQAQPTTSRQASVSAAVGLVEIR